MTTISKLQTIYHLPSMMVRRFFVVLMLLVWTLGSGAVNSRWTTGTSVDVAAASSDRFYVYNIKYGTFLYFGSTWSTRAVAHYIDTGLSFGVATYSGQTGTYSLQSGISNEGSEANYLGHTRKPSDTGAWYLDARRYNSESDSYRYEGALYFLPVSSPEYPTNTYRIRTYNENLYLALGEDGTTTDPSSEPGEEGMWLLISQKQFDEIRHAESADDYGGLNANVSELILARDFNRGNQSIDDAWKTTTNPYSDQSTEGGRYDWPSGYGYNEGWATVVKRKNLAGLIKDDDYDLQKAYAQYYHMTMEGRGLVYQEIKVPEVGYYRLSCQGFYATQTSGNKSSLYVRYWGEDDSWNVLTSDLINRSSELNSFVSSARTDTEALNQAIAAGQAFYDKQYTNSLIFYVDDPNNLTVRIGIQKTGATRQGTAWPDWYYDRDYTAFDDFQLHFLGYPLYILDEDATLDGGSKIGEYLKYEERTKVDNNKNVTTLLKRTFSLGMWNSFCLPIRMTSAQIRLNFGEDTQLAQLVGVNNKNPYQIDFEEIDLLEEGTAIQPGQFYIIKPSLGPTGSNIIVNTKVFAGPFYTLGRCNIMEYDKDTNPTGNFKTSFEEQKFKYDGADDIKAKGTFLTVADGCPKDAYVFSKGEMYKLQSPMNIKGFRCWIQDIEPAEGSGAKSDFTFSVADLNGNVTAIELPSMPKVSLGREAVYTLNGQRINCRLDQLQKGIYIVNGKKVVIK